MVSFDVVSLFTKVPVDEALEVITTLLCKDDTLEEHTTISMSDICHLTKLCMKSIYFQCQDEFFEQVKGAAVGSLLSPVVANLCMESFEQSALTFPLTSHLQGMDLLY